MKTSVQQQCCQRLYLCSSNESQMRNTQGHPEEVYGCEFVGGSGQQLVTGSAESLFLWDVSSGARLAEAGPPSELRGEAPGAPFTLCLFLLLPGSVPRDLFSPAPATARLFHVWKGAIRQEGCTWHAQAPSQSAGSRAMCLAWRRSPGRERCWPPAAATARCVHGPATAQG